MTFSEKDVDEVLSRNNIVDVINSYVSLRPRGNSYWACCPFHHEKTPSFKVDRDNQLFYCFGCHMGGNVFTFVMEYENMNFPESVEYLANRVGMSLSEHTASEADRAKDQYRNVLKEMNKEAALYFYKVMMYSESGKKGYAYFKNRGLTDETIRSFGLGYADITRNDLYNYLRHKGYTDEQLKNSGLVRIEERTGGSDIFWNRVMIPIFDANGKVIAFGGRVLGDAEPKYLNTSETEVFNKRRVLFAMNFAKRSRRKGFICCEGYMDVIALHQAGFDNAVGYLGTAITLEHANLLKRYAKEQGVYLAPDTDDSGIRAAQRGIAILREVGMSVRVIDLRPYKDPDELIRAIGSEGFEERLNQAESAMMFETRILYEKYNQQDPEERTRFQHECAKKLAMIEEVLERTNYIESIANRYHMDSKALAELVHQYAVSGVLKPEIIEREERRAQNESTKRSNENKTEKLLLTWLVSEPDLFDELDGIIDEQSFEEGIYRIVAEKLFTQYRNNGKVEPASIVASFDDLEDQRLVAEMMQTDLRGDVTPEETDMAITDVVRKIKTASIEDKLSHVNDIKEMQALILEKAQIAKLHISLKKG